MFVSCGFSAVARVVLLSIAPLLVHPVLHTKSVGAFGCRFAMVISVTSKGLVVASSPQAGEAIHFAPQQTTRRARTAITNVGRSSPQHLITPPFPSFAGPTIFYLHNVMVVQCHPAQGEVRPPPALDRQTDILVLGKPSTCGHFLICRVLRATEIQNTRNQCGAGESLIGEDGS